MLVVLGRALLEQPLGLKVLEEVLSDKALNLIVPLKGVLSDRASNWASFDWDLANRASNWAPLEGDLADRALNWASFDWDLSDRASSLTVRLERAFLEPPLGLVLLEAWGVVVVVVPSGFL